MDRKTFENLCWDYQQKLIKHTDTDNGEGIGEAEQSLEDVIKEFRLEVLSSEAGGIEVIAETQGKERVGLLWDASGPMVCWLDERTLYPFTLVWDNGHATGTIDHYETVAKAIEDGDNWIFEMLSIDENPDEARVQLLGLSGWLRAAGSRARLSRSEEGDSLMKFHYEIKLSLHPCGWENQNIQKYIRHALKNMGDFEAEISDIRLVRREQAPEHPMMERMGRLLLQRWFIAPLEERTIHGMDGLMETLRLGLDFVITPEGERQPFIWPEEVNAPTKSLEEIDDAIEATRLAYESIVYGEAHPSDPVYTTVESLEIRL